jgi:hypothetical protein
VKKPQLDGFISIENVSFGGRPSYRIDLHANTQYVGADYGDFPFGERRAVEGLCCSFYVHPRDQHPAYSADVQYLGRDYIRAADLEAMSKRLGKIERFIMAKREEYGLEHDSAATGQLFALALPARFTIKRKVLVHYLGEEIASTLASRHIDEVVLTPTAVGGFLRRLVSAIVTHQQGVDGQLAQVS